ncbi:MAG: DUF4416 family protein [Bacteriovoracia bacterium]
MRHDLKDPSLVLSGLGIMWKPSDFSEDSIKEIVSRTFGSVCLSFGPFSFSEFSEYYTQEMGSPLLKSFFVFDKKVSRNDLVSLKKTGYILETEFLEKNHRKINIDPFIVTPENVVISTSKNFSHRIYLGQGVFGDLVLIYKNKSFQRLPWSYADYVKYASFFEKARQLLF